MQVRNARDLGLLIRDRRRRLSLSQAELAERIGVSRHWVMGVEAGKPTVELGMVLDAISALGLVCNLRSRDTSVGARGPESPPLPSDLSRILSRTRASGRDSTGDLGRDRT